MHRHAMAPRGRRHHRRPERREVLVPFRRDEKGGKDRCVPPVTTATPHL